MNRFRSSLLVLALSLFSFVGIAPVQPQLHAQAMMAAQLIDINTASPDQLKSLKGIGDAYAKRIIAGRPYTAKNQLSTRGIIPAATYNGIKDQIIAKAGKK